MADIVLRSPSTGINLGGTAPPAVVVKAMYHYQHH